MCTNLKFCAGRVVPCGKCEECLKTKRITEYNRIKYEYENSSIVYHITLTYARVRDFDGFADIRAFIKRLREEVGDCSYYCVYEEGELRGRPHFHILIFFEKSNFLSEEIVSKSWGNGFVRRRIINRVCEVRYLTNYLFKHYGVKNIRNFSCSNNFGYKGFLKKYFPQDYLSYITKGEVQNDFISRYFDVDNQLHIVDHLYYGTWRYLPRIWKEKYYKLVNDMLSLFDYAAVRKFYDKNTSILLNKQVITVRYFDNFIDFSKANGYYIGKGRCEEFLKTYKCAGIFYGIFVPQFGLRNLCGPILDYYIEFCKEHLDYFYIEFSQVPKEWNQADKRIKYVRETRSDFLCKEYSTNYFGVEGVFKLDSNKLNNVVFL